MTTPAAPFPSRRPERAAAFDAVAESKALLRKIRVGALATLMQDGAPFATLTGVATDPAGHVILLLSRLAAHTRNLEQDGRCSLLLAQEGRGDPLAHPRLTVEALAERDRDPTLRARFLRRNPKAALYADFPDFSFWRAQLTGVHLNGGFGRAADLSAEDVLTPLQGAATLIASEEAILGHLNADHADALALLAQKSGGGAGRWQASGLDPEGLDLIAGDASARIVFPRRIETPTALREKLVEMAAKARGETKTG